MYFKGWDLYNLVVGFVNTIITKWFKQENPFDDFNSKVSDFEAFSKSFVNIFYNGKA